MHIQRLTAFGTIDIPNPHRVKSDPPVFRDGFAEIAVTKGRTAKVDVADVDMVQQYRWHLRTSKTSSGGIHYAITDLRSKGGPMLPMHQLLLPPPDGLEVDHINGDGLDNRRSNLRLATRSQQQKNRRSSFGRKGFKGVHYVPKHNRWQAQIVRGKKRGCYLGRFLTAEDAARAYDIAILARDGELAVTNKLLGLLD